MEWMMYINGEFIKGKNEKNFDTINPFDGIQVVRDYALRWKIEENFKYKKQQFSFEKIKVRKIFKTFTRKRIY